ncbi:CREB-regulated transcription coactivator 1-like isoform X2 [Macrosteles quadrilineatus]|uniref:CREB-regulated transcription coactivator 1-like isoform X2 n=1 Tax=Macrosteles quadrilineatus TaxID=74068 RepID=UPI0023E0BBE1|nr:CREB-regulated transcription coactivator 1-like isoform X2 [Macrosteles quadrilineatus]
MANTNPRKFVEKIALHTQRMAEEKAQVDKILREVAEVTRRGNPMPKQHLRINQNLGSFKGGSLPNVNNIATSSSVDLKSALSNLEEMNGGRSDTQIVYRDRGRTMTSGGPMRSRPGERRHDTSPYSSGPYLSPPPPDSNWRRTYSDSSLHQSAAAQTNESQRRAMDGQLTDGYEPSRRHLSVSPDGRPRSCEVPRVPGINIFPSAQEPGTVQIPIGNNTGSLPDLTSFQFSSPLPTPLDQEDHNSSPYSNGVTLDNSGGGGGKEQFSPQMVYQSTQRSPSPQHSMQPCSPLPIAQSSSPVPVVDYVNSLNSYRSPHPVNRPSPQNSPGLTVKYGSASPLSSSPQSPSPSSPSSTGPISFPEHNSYYITQDQANMLQHNFEQFSMRDSQGSLDYIGSTNNTSPYSQTDDPCPQELTQDPGYFSTSPSQQLQYSTRHSAQTTPNTPSSIPDIVLTDFSSTAEELANRNDEFTKELGVAMAGAFDTDEAFREGLGIIDFDALQMLTDPTEIITDPNAEEHFRQDRFQ